MPVDTLEDRANYFLPKSGVKTEEDFKALLLQDIARILAEQGVAGAAEPGTDAIGGITALNGDNVVTPETSQLDIATGSSEALNEAKEQEIEPKNAPKGTAKKGATKGDTPKKDTQKKDSQKDTAKKDTTKKVKIAKTAVTVKQIVNDSDFAVVKDKDADVVNSQEAIAKPNDVDEGKHDNEPVGSDLNLTVPEPKDKQDLTTPIKRGRGRPRKDSIVTNATANKEDNPSTTSPATSPNKPENIEAKATAVTPAKIATPPPSPSQAATPIKRGRGRPRKGEEVNKEPPKTPKAPKSKSDISKKKDNKEKKKAKLADKAKMLEDAELHRRPRKAHRRESYEHDGKMLASPDNGDRVMVGDEGGGCNMLQPAGNGDQTIYNDQAGIEGNLGDQPDIGDMTKALGQEYPGLIDGLADMIQNGGAADILRAHENNANYHAHPMPLALPVGGGDHVPEYPYPAGYQPLTPIPPSGPGPRFIDGQFSNTVTRTGYSPVQMYCPPSSGPPMNFNNPFSSNRPYPSLPPLPPPPRFYGGIPGYDYQPGNGLGGGTGDPFANPANQPAFGAGNIGGHQHQHGN